VRPQAPVRQARHDVSERAAPVDPELPPRTTHQDFLSRFNKLYRRAGELAEPTKGSEMACHNLLAEHFQDGVFLRRPGQSLTARHQRQHQWSPAPVLPEGQRPIGLHTRRSGARGEATEQPAAEDPQLADTRPGLRPRASLTTPTVLRRPDEFTLETNRRYWVSFQARRHSNQSEMGSPPDALHRKC
jgi:hypothetical protein